MRLFNTFFLVIIALFISACAPKMVDIKSINPTIQLQNHQTLSVYEPKNDTIVFYEFFLKEGVWMSHTWGKMLPFRIEFMDLWITGLGHDIKRLTDNNADNPRDALMYNARQKGLISLHVNEKDYLLDSDFANKMVDFINAYEEKMRRYEKEREFPLILRK